VRHLPEASTTVQRELLSLVGKLSVLPSGLSMHTYLESEDPLVRREAVRILLRNPGDRDETVVAALSDPDDRVVFAGLSAAQDKCPPIGINLIKQRVDRGELDSQLRTMGIRIIAQTRTPDALDWLLPYVMTETNWARRPKLRPSSAEMLAALSMIATHWRTHPAAEPALKLAEQSRDPEVRAKVARTRATTATPDSKHE
jgi:HEAT repeat protein